MQLRVIDTGYNDAFLNMAIDEALLASRLPVLRIYGWKPAGLSIGYFQDIDKIDTERCRKLRIGVVRRLTGGDAVLHDKELTYSFIIDEGSMPKGVIDSYKAISKGIVDALGSIGLKAEMNELVEKDKKSMVCFNNPSWYEIVIGKKKVVGSAQKRVGGKILQHGSVLLEADIEKMASLFNVDDKISLIARLKERVTSINEELKKKVMYSTLSKAMEKGFKDNLKAKVIKDRLTPEELASAEKLSKEKYSTEGWNYRR